MIVSSIAAVPEEAPLAAVPVAEICAACGFPSPAQDYATDEIDLNEHLLPHRVSSYIMRTSGDSMVGVGIWDGDEIIVDCSVTPQPGDVVVAAVDGEMLVKRYDVVDGVPVLLAENPDYPPLRVPELADVRVWGVVTYGLRHIINRPF